MNEIEHETHERLEKKGIVAESLERIKDIRARIKERLGLSDPDTVAVTDEFLVETAEETEEIGDADRAVIAGVEQIVPIEDGAEVVESSGENPIDTMEQDGHGALVTEAVKDLAEAILPTGEVVARVVIEHIEEVRQDGQYSLEETPAEAERENTNTKARPTAESLIEDYTNRSIESFSEEDQSNITALQERRGLSYEEAIKYLAELDFHSYMVHPDFDVIIKAEKNNKPFTEEQQKAINTGIETLQPDHGSFEMWQGVLDELRREGFGNDEIVLVFKSYLYGDAECILHRAEIFSARSEAIRQALGVEIDGSNQPERYLYHGSKFDLTEADIRSYVEKGILCGQKNEVSTSEGTKNWATTIETGSGGYNLYFRMGKEKLIKNGYTFEYDASEDEDSETDGKYTGIPLLGGEAIRPELIEFRIDVLGVYVPLKKAEAVLDILEKVKKGEMTIDQIPKLEVGE